MRPLLWTTVARTYTGVVSVAVGVVVGRLFGPAPRGAYEVLAKVRLGLQAVAFLAVANTYFTVREPGLLPRVAGSSLALGLALGAVLGGALAAAKALDPSWLAVGGAGATVFFAAAPAIVASHLLGGALLGSGRLRAWNGAIAANRTVVLGGLLVVGLVPALSSLDAVLVSLAAAEWAGLAVAVVALRGAGSLSLRVDLPLVRRMARYGAVASLHGLIAFGLLHADVFVVERRLGSAVAGHYGVAALAREVVMFVPWLASLLVLPRVAGDAADRGAHARALGHPSLAVAAAVGAVLWIGAPEILVRLHRPDFAPAVELARILIPGALLLGFALVLFQDLLGRGGPRAVLWIPGLGLGALLAADLVLLPGAGAQAAAWAWTAVSALVAGLGFLAQRRHARG